MHQAWRLPQAPVLRLGLLQVNMLHVQLLLSQLRQLQGVHLCRLQSSDSELTQINTVDAPLLSRTDGSYPVRAQDCAGWNQTQLSEGYPALEEMETQLQCAGWCQNTSSLFYRFTNINNGTDSD